MIGLTNVGGGNVIAFISVTYPTGSTCTCTKGTKTLRAKGTTGTMVFKIPEAGTWTVSITDGTETVSEDVIVTDYSAHTLSIDYDSIPKLKTYANGIDAPVLMSNTVGDYINWGSFTLTRTTNEPVLVIVTDANTNANVRRVAYVSSTNAIINEITKSATTVNVNGPTEMTTGNGRRLYIVWGGNTSATTNFSLSLYNHDTTKTVNANDVLAHLVVSTGKVAADDSSAEALEQAAQLNNVLNRYAILAEAEVVET